MSVQRVFYDSEFDEDGRTIRPLSLGFYAPCYKCNDTGSYPPFTRQVCDHCNAEGGRGLYVVITDANRERCNEFVQEHVIPYLDVEPGGRCETVRCTKAEAGKIILDWLRSLAPQGSVRLEFWANFGSYDWVLFAQLYGKMVDLPWGLPQMINDLKQELLRRGYTRKSEIPDFTEGMQLHNAYDDAVWVWRVLRWLEQTA